MARNKKVEILSNDKEVLHPMTDGDCVIFEDGQTLTQKLSEDDSVKYTPEIVNSSPMFKVGEGNTVDYSDNVLDGAYERASLQGQTYVNYIQESSADEITLPTPFTEYERTQHNTLTSDEEGTLGINLVGQSYVNALQHDSEEEYVVLGESLEFQEKKVEYTNEGQIKSAMLKGQTLVNEMTFVETVEADKRAMYEANYALKSGSVYTLILPNIGSDKKVSVDFFYYSTGTYKRYFYTTSRKTVFTAEEDEFLKNIVATDEASVNDCLNAILLEGDYSNMDIPYFEGMQSVTVSTKLENLCHKHTTSDLAKTGKTFNTNSINDRLISLASVTDGGGSLYEMKSNTKYLVQFKISNLVLDGLESIGLQFSVSTIDTGNCLFEDGTITGLVTTNGVYRVVLTTSNLISTSSVEIKGIPSQWESSGSSLRKMTISEIMYVEYQNGMENWDLPYFEDYQVMKPVQVESVNKNIFTTQDVLGTNAATYTIHDVNSVTITGTDDTRTYKNVQFLINVKPNTDYKISYKYEKPSGETTAHCDVYSVPKNGEAKKYLGGATINSGEYTQLEVRFFVNTTEASQNGTIRYYDIQMEEGDTATSYVPHQSKTTYSWDEVILRKIGDVEDTLDLTTGEWVQRIGEIVLDGYNNQFIEGLQEQKGDYLKFGLKLEPYAKYEYDAYLVCDKVKTATRVDTESNQEQITIHYHNEKDTELRITILPSKLSTPDTDGFNEYLSKNPIKVQYQLETPIIHKVNLSRPNLQVYDDITHVHTKCLDGTLIPNIYLPSDISYPAILESGKNYNVSINHTQVSTDNPLTVNVGGTELVMTDSRMTLTTPTTLANSTVSFTGKGNKIKESMLIKNSSLLTRDLPHFNGIGSVQLGKTIENLCSASGFKAGNSNATITWYDNYAHTNISTTAGSCVFAYELIKLLENGKKYFIYSPQTLGNDSCRASFRRRYDGILTYSMQQTLLLKNGKCIIEINQQDNPYTHICVGCHHAIPLNTEFDVYRPIICEYELGMEDWDWESIGYFTGTKNIGNEFMRVQNKNLIDVSKIVKGVTYNHGGFSTTSEYGGRLTLRQKDAIPVKLNSVYTVSISPSDFTMGYYLLDEDKNIVYDSGWTANPVSFSINQPNAKYLIFNLKKQSGEAIEVSDITSIQLEESSSATTYTAHKHNGLYITKDQPIELTWEQGQVQVVNNGDTYTSAINNALSNRVRNKGLLNLKPNTTYRLSLGNKTDYKYHIACFNNYDAAVSAITGIGTSWVSSFDTIFTTTKDMHKIGINVAKVGDGAITPPESVHAQVRLEEVTDVVLRSCTGKYDELDLTRGTYTQNVGMVYLDGVNQHSNYITVVGDTYQPTDTTLKTFDIRCDGVVVDSICLSNKFPMRESMESTAINFESVRIHSTNTSCRLTIKKEKASTLEEFKLWLQDNPLEIIYALKTPIVHQVFVGNKNEANTEVTKPNDIFTLPTLYTEQTHIDMTNNGIVPKVQSRDYIAYPVLPMVSRTYTLQHNLTGGVSNLTIDLLGRTQEITYQEPKSLIYSPVTMDAILHHELRISGKGKISRVMYIDGGYMDRDIPYIEGMKNAVNPIVKNIGKNLFNYDSYPLTYDGEYYMGTCRNLMSYNTPCYGKTVVISGRGYTDSTAKQPRLHIYYTDGTNEVVKYISSTDRNNPTEFRKITLKPVNYISIRYHTNGVVYLKDIYVGIENTNYKPYEENICYVDCGEIRLTPDMFEQGSVNNTGDSYESDKNTAKTRIRTKELIELEPGVQYVILGDDSMYKYSAHFFDKDGMQVKGSYDLSWKGNQPFTIPNDAPMAAFFVAYQDNRNFTVDDVDFNFQLVKVSEIKQMRSLPNGVYDEIDLETGTYIQRVGEITFNGTENWTVGYSSWDNKYTYYNNNFVDIKLMKGDNGSGQAYYDAVRCPQLHRSYMGRLASVLIDGVCSYYYSGYQRIFISKQDCATVDELKLWLQENPITVQYELSEPIVKDIVIHNYPHSYEDGHVIIENGDPNTPIPAQLTYRAVTNRSGQIQQHTEQVEKQEREINELETLILANIHLSQTR